jgi:hypothetical protein
MSEANCKQAKEKVYDYLAQELDEESKVEINLHLKSCINCAGEYAVELQISSFISSSSLNKITTDELVSKAFAQLDSEEEA